MPAYLWGLQGQRSQCFSRNFKISKKAKSRDAKKLHLLVSIGQRTRLRAVLTSQFFWVNFIYIPICYFKNQAKKLKKIRSAQNAMTIL